MPKAKLQAIESHEARQVGVPGAARFLEVAENTIRRWAAEGVLPHVRDYNNRRVFRVADLEVHRRQRAR